MLPKQAVRAAPPYSSVDLQLQAVGGHPHVVHWHAAHMRADDSFVVCLELGFCDILEVLHSCKERGLQARYRLREWMLQLAVALQAVHSKGVAHRDVKPENLLLCTRHEASLKSGSTQRVKEHVGPPVPPTSSLARAVWSDLQSTMPSTVQAAMDGDEEAADELLVAMPALHKQYKKAALADVLAQEVTGMRPILKLCDFGYASTVREGEQVPVGYSPVGSMRYAAPEVYMRHLIFTEEFEFVNLWGRERMASLQQEPYDSRFIDVWSFGVTLYVLVFGSMPFRAACVNDRRFRAFVRDSDPSAIALEVCAPDAAYWSASYDQRPWKWPKGTTPALKHLLRQCMRVDPEKRWTFAQIREHPWFGTPEWVPPDSEELAEHPLHTPPSPSLQPSLHPARNSDASSDDDAGDTPASARSPKARAAKAGTGTGQLPKGPMGSLQDIKQQTTELMPWLKDLDEVELLGGYTRAPPQPGWPVGSAPPCVSHAEAHAASNVTYDVMLHKRLQQAQILRCI